MKDKTDTPPTITIEPSSTEEVTCDINNWRIDPIEVIEIPVEDGWKYVLIYLTLSNYSPYWGNITYYDLDNITIRSEDGFGYIVESGYIELPNNPRTCFSEGNFTQNCGVNNLYKSIVPPKFFIGGDNGMRYKFERKQSFIFKVAESQDNFTLNISSTIIRCIMPNGEVKYEETILRAQFEKNLPEYSNMYPLIEDWGFQELLGSTIEVQGVGKLRFTKLERRINYGGDEEALYMHYEFANSNVGYESSGDISGYIIGDDGIARTPGCIKGSCKLSEDTYTTNHFSAGPGQTSNGIIGIMVPRNINNLKYVLYMEDHNIFEVFNIDKDSIQ